MFTTTDFVNTDIATEPCEPRSLYKTKKQQGIEKEIKC